MTGDHPKSTTEDEYPQNTDGKSQWRISNSQVPVTSHRTSSYSPASDDDPKHPFQQSTRNAHLTRGRNLNSDSMENSTRNEIQLHATTDVSSCEKNTFVDREQRRPTRYSSDRRFVGLTNMGNSCCVNVLLQILFMTPEYRNLILRCQQEGILKTAPNHIPYQLSKMFQHLQGTTERPASPRSIIHCLWLNDINMGVQQDAEEIFRFIFCLVQNQLEGTDFVTDVNKLFIITTEEYTRCLECLQKIKQTGSMLTIPISLCNPSTVKLENIENSLATFFEPQKLDAGNMCYCDRCRKKTVTMKSYGVISYPQILCLQLKRFYFSTDWERTVKNYDFMEFPETLHLKNSWEESHSQMNKFQYRLMSVIVHVGSASFGHYYAYIRSFPEMEWYCFMDECIRKATWEDIKETFGSSRGCSGRSGCQMGGTAYLLFYRRMG
ncbi:ubl carboxyl-terminal hydrolase 18-like [Pristis pectinata]|uniref:ubl carboxyl-terminal hydrolase 18-like n=1 Tax=Pristis pectinata TaxID=685728 RepID=UPI00223DDC82|nr:ubl carboxyl-terminal hydrolase 18-like [Pristis pectinata]